MAFCVELTITDTANPRVSDAFRFEGESGVVPLALKAVVAVVAAYPYEAAEIAEGIRVLGEAIAVDHREFVSDSASWTCRACAKYGTGFASWSAHREASPSCATGDKWNDHVHVSFAGPSQPPPGPRLFDLGDVLSMGPQEVAALHDLAAAEADDVPPNAGSAS